VPSEDLVLGRDSFSRRQWVDASVSLSRAAEESSLGAEDLELLACASYMLGHDDDYVEWLQRAHRVQLEAGDHGRAARCAFWIGHNLVFRGQAAPAKGWFARAQRLLDREPSDSVDHGYLQIADLLDHVFAGDAVGAQTVAARIIRIGERFDDKDLTALGMMEQGHALVRQGQSREGLRLVDETMIAVTVGELSPIVAGIVYCNTIIFCRGIFDVRRAREWTAALTRWCDEQPQMVAHNGQCLLHRAEIMTLEGGWADALHELRRLEEQYVAGVLNRLALGDAAYQRGEVHRLRGEFEQAEVAFDEASQRGRQPQPGLALLRLAQGREGDAAAAVRRAVTETTTWSLRATLLPGYVRVMLDVRDIDAARTACRELEDIAASHDAPILHAWSLHATGATALAANEPEAALVALRRAWQTWEELGATYEAARVRVEISLSCQGLGDADSATLELKAARRVFAELGAAPDLKALDALSRAPGPGPAWPDRPRARGHAPGRRRQQQPGRGLHPRHQRTHRRPPLAEHLSEAGRLFPHRGQRLCV